MSHSLPCFHTTELQAKVLIFMPTNVRQEESAYRVHKSSRNPSLRTRWHFRKVQSPTRDSGKAIYAQNQSTRYSAVSLRVCKLWLLCGLRGFNTQRRDATETVIFFFIFTAFSNFFPMDVQ